MSTLDWLAFLAYLVVVVLPVMHALIQYGCKGEQQEGGTR